LGAEALGAVVEDFGGRVLAEGGDGEAEVKEEMEENEEGDPWGNLRRALDGAYAGGDGGAALKNTCSNGRGANRWRTWSAEGSNAATVFLLWGDNRERLYGIRLTTYGCSGE